MIKNDIYLNTSMAMILSYYFDTTAGVIFMGIMYLTMFMEEYYEIQKNAGHY